MPTAGSKARVIITSCLQNGMLPSAPRGRLRFARLTGIAKGGAHSRRRRGMGKRKMQMVRKFSVIALGAIATAIVTISSARADDACPAGALGVSRTVEVDTTGGPWFGEPYGDRDFLAQGRDRPDIRRWPFAERHARHPGGACQGMHQGDVLRRRQHGRRASRGPERGRRARSHDRNAHLVASQSRRHVRFARDAGNRSRPSTRCKRLVRARWRLSSATHI